MIQILFRDYVKERWNQGIKKKPTESTAPRPSGRGCPFTNKLFIDSLSGRPHQAFSGSPIESLTILDLQNLRGHGRRLPGELRHECT
jgi:hypothetical protein